MERPPVRATFVFAVCCMAVLSTTLPAMAKGPSQGVITGPRLPAPIRLSEPDTRISHDLAHVVIQSGFFEGMWGGEHLLTQRTREDLGPRYTITYTMSQGDGRSDSIVQYVFPYAEPLPITQIPAEQQYWDSNETVGGWYVARHRFRDTLIRLGLPASAAWLGSAGKEAARVAFARHDPSMPSGSLAAAIVLMGGLAAILYARSRRVKTRKVAS
jgi:hypothetical protein